jgi:hypothetical protein
MINVTLGEVKTQEKHFPKLMLYTLDGHTTVVHFKKRCNTGIQVYSSNPINSECQMKETDGWLIEDFVDFEAIITLQNA